MWSRLEGPDRLVIRYIPWVWMGVALLFWFVTLVSFVWGNDQAQLDCQRHTETSGECVFERSTLLSYENVSFPIDDLRRARNGESQVLRRIMVEWETGDPSQRLVLHGESNKRAQENLEEIQGFLADPYRQELRIEYSNLAGGLVLSALVLFLAMAFSVAAVRIGTLRINRRQRIIEISRRSIWGTSEALIFDFDEIEAIDVNSSADLHGFDEDSEIPFRAYEQVGQPLVLRMKDGTSVHLADPHANE